MLASVNNIIYLPVIEFECMTKAGYVKRSEVPELPCRLNEAAFMILLQTITHLLLADTLNMDLIALMY